MDDLFNPNKTLAIIGTAGRKEDGLKLGLHEWNCMTDAAYDVIDQEGITHLVSGGAAWADHVAVLIHIHNEIPLTLYVPGSNRDIDIARYYHLGFSRILGRDTFAEVASLPCSMGGSFKDRNVKVANAADVYLAITFGHGREVKDGGTAHTVALMDKRSIPGYHFDLNTFKLHKR